MMKPMLRAMPCLKREVRPFAASGALVCAAVLLASCAADAPVVSTTPALYRNLEQAGAVLDVNHAASIISAYRANKGLGPVSVDLQLVALAQSHATQQARANKVGHTVGGAFAARIKGLEQARAVSVENVSAGYRTFGQAFSGWRESKRHNDNLLSSKVTRLGIAKAVNSNSKYRVFWTLIMTADPG